MMIGTITRSVDVFRHQAQKACSFHTPKISSCAMQLCRPSQTLAVPWARRDWGDQGKPLCGQLLWGVSL